MALTPQIVWGGSSPDPQTLNKIIQTIDGLSLSVLTLKRRVFATEAAEKLRAAGREPRMPLAFQAQFGEDLWLWDLFGGKLEGKFIEVGAFDGHHLSVTYGFEAVGWTGYLIEPIPECFEACRQRRKASRVVHAALSKRGSSGTATFTQVPRYGTMSYLTADQRHQSMVKQAEGGGERKITVPLTTMDAVLGDEPGPIDFAVIDVEGGEHDLLNGFDLDRYRPRVIMIEEGLQQPVSPFLHHMSEHGYLPVAYVAINRVFIRNDERELLERAAQIPPL